MPLTKSQNKTGSSRPPSPILAFGLIAVTLGALFLIAFRDITTNPPAGDLIESGSVAIEGTPLPAYALPDSAIGQLAPSLLVQSQTGEQITLASDGETARVFGFFAHWCPHCQAELPVVSNLLDETDIPPGVEVIAVSTAVDPNANNYPPSAWFAAEAWTSTVLVDDERNSLASAMGVTAFPFWVVVDNNGAVTTRIAGSVEPSTLTDILQDLAQGANT